MASSANARRSTLGAFVGLIALAACGYATVPLRRVVLEKRQQVRGTSKELFVPAPTTLLRVSLGYREAFADLLWIRALVHFGETFDAKHTMDWLGGYCRGINALAPKWRRPYEWGGNVITFQTGVLRQSEVKESIELFEAGLKHFPNDANMLFALASRYISDLQVTDPKERDRIHQRGAMLLAKAARQPGTPPFWTTLASKIWNESGRRDLAILSLREQLLQADDQERREVLKKALAQLESEAAATTFARESETFTQRRKARAPYAAEALFPLLDEGADAPPYDREAIVSDPRILTDEPITP